MVNLQELAEEKAMEIVRSADGSATSFTFALRGYNKGYKDHAQLAVEDKKELLEALKRLHESLNTYGAHPIIDAQVNKVIKKHETI